MNLSALITGATGGIGQALARQLSAAGFSIFITGRDEKKLAALREELGCAGAALDLSLAGAATRVYAMAKDSLGQIEILINNAGFNKAKTPLVDVTDEDIDQSYALNLRAPMLLSREALRDMGGRRAGHIVNVISSVVYLRAENFSLYTAMKNALHAFNGCLIKEARLVGIKVTGVYPGGVNTGFRAQARPDYMRPESVATLILNCIMAPDDAVIHEITFRPMVESNF